MTISREALERYKRERGIVPVEIRGVDAHTCTFSDADGRVYRQIRPNFWTAAESRETEVVYLHSNLHHGGIVLNPVFLRIGESWINAFTGEYASLDVGYPSQASPPLPRRQERNRDDERIST